MDQKASTKEPTAEKGEVFEALCRKIPKFAEKFQNIKWGVCLKLLRPENADFVRSQMTFYITMIWQREDLITNITFSDPYF